MVELKVISYNVHSCVGSDMNYSVDRIGQVLERQDPAVVCLQEIEANHSTQQTRVWSSVHSSHQPRELASSLALEHCHFAPAISSVASSRYREVHDCSDAKGGFGIATLSKYPILEVRRRTFHRLKTIRNALACLIALPNGAKVWVVNTHLGCHWGGEQFQQAKELARFIDSLGMSSETCGPEDVSGIILCGDFNSLPFFRSVKVMKSFGLIDTWGTKGLGPGCTFPADGKIPGLRDFVLAADQ
eukprot:CAMPEP_0113530088 /NCGR_PEP_ID=MMETSP0015_2-20120614/2745_1 /TAXON_ID=2838 /ORGANISM="Odontella" /LENGTH=243 /DNA_ID=CAMNT_0000428771 /DNA_START=62 /DNA_END=794 /DNA_ORIENTATION=- /assembly_acc=CAM_ASM_000160